MSLKNISIHEAAKASTADSNGIPTILTYFNPRSRKGFDMYALSIMGLKYISIHEAAKASTTAASLNWCMLTFQSTKPQRLRQLARIQWELDNHISIHEAAKASTLLAVSTSANGTDFNPRSRKGFDRLLNLLALQ